MKRKDGTTRLPVGKRRRRSARRPPFILQDAAQLVLFLTSPITSEDNGIGAKEQYVRPFSDKSDTYRLIAFYGDEYGNRTFVRLAEDVTTGNLWICFRPTMLEGIHNELVSLSEAGFTSLLTGKRTSHCLGNLYDICHAVHASDCDTDGISFAYKRLLNEPMKNTGGKGVLSCLEDHVNSFQGRGSIIFAGFSLGAAQALCAACMLSSARVHCVQIAGPRAASRDSARTLERSLASCTYIGIRGDPVSHMPFRAGHMSHVGQERWVDSAAIASNLHDEKAVAVHMTRFVTEVALGLVFGVRWGLSQATKAFLDVHLVAEECMYEVLCKLFG